jgi:hypothetical protein
MAATEPIMIIVAAIAEAIINLFLSLGLASPQSNISSSPSLKPSSVYSKTNTP